MLKLSNAALAEAVLDTVPQIVWTALPDGTCTYLNRRWYDFTGRDRDSRSALNWIAAVHPDDREQAIEAWRTAAAAREKFENQFRLRTSNGAYRWVLAQATAEIVDGIILGWCGTCTDIHDHVLAQAELRETASINRSILAATPDCIKLIEADGTILYLNPLGHLALEIEDPAPLMGACWFDLLAPEASQAAREAARLSLATGENQQLTIKQPTVTGREKWFDIVITPAGHDGEAPDRMLVIARDITGQKEAEQALRDSDVLHRSVLEASADCIKIISLAGDLQLMNAPGICSMELENLDVVKGRNWASLWPRQARATVVSAVEDAASGKTVRFTGFCPTAKGTPKWWDVVVSPMVDNGGDVVRLLSISRDITAHRETSEQLRWASEHDGLTSLPNRKSFQAHLQASIISAMASGQSVGLLLVDLDHFKHVNDTLGHAAGDYLLTTFGERLKGCVRGGDLVARLGGDEFAVILRGVKGEDDLLRAGESILKRLGAPISFDGRALSAGASIGGAIFPQDASNANELFNNADTALYALKASGRGGTRMFHNHMRAEAQKVASQLSLARVALSQKSVFPHYQQKVDLKSGKICGFEALLRWQHPTRGVQYPETVAEAFKDYELASKIGELMQTSVFSDMRRWLDNGMDFGCISINAAPAEFLRDDYAERLLSRLAEHQVPATLVEVEVTEHVFLERGSEFVSRALQLLSESGVQIALDDFGTGYSSLSHLRDFPVDVVKIDRSFIEKMVDQPEISAIVSAVIDLAASLDIRVVAEGVETLEQEEVLRAKTCTFGQGYLFGRPVTSGEVPHLLR